VFQNKLVKVRDRITFVRRDENVVSESKKQKQQRLCAGGFSKPFKNIYCV